MNFKFKKKTIKRLKFLLGVVICAVIVELFYIGYSLSFQNKETLYFDGINAIDKEGKVIVGVGSNNNNDLHYEKAKLSYYNQNFEKTFEKLYNVGYNSSFFDVKVLEDGVVAVGSYEKEEEEHKKSIRRALIVKYDLEGNILFEKDFQLLDNSKFTSVEAYEDAYYVTGQSVYQNTKIGKKDGGAILLKYDKDGTLLWKTTFGNNKVSVFNDLLITDNFIFAVGISESHFGLLCKYDLDGNLVSMCDFKYMDDIGFSGIVRVDDTIYVSGATQYGNETEGLIIQYDFDCNYLNQVIYESDGAIRFNKLVFDNDTIVAIGIVSTNKNSSDKTADNLNYDGIIGKFKLDLKQLSVVTYGDERDDYFTDIMLLDNHYLVTGYSSYEDGSYLSKFIHYSDALKILEVEG